MFFLLNPVLFITTNMLLLYTFRRDLFKKFIVFSYINIVKFKIISETYYLDFKQRYLTNKPNKEESVPKELDEDCYLLIYVNPDNTCDEQVCIEEEMMNKQIVPLEYIQQEKHRVEEYENMAFLAFFCSHIGDTLYYFRIHENTTEDDLEELTIAEQPFIQIDLLQNEEEINIKDKLKGFYLKNNKILDREFLIWFVDRFLNKELHEEYSVNIIDSEANMFQINNNETQVSNSIIL